MCRMDRAEGTFFIGEAAARAGVSPDTIRYYERLGVIACSI
jgi:DNA-binding transcriptional MerR regulator